MIFSSRCLAFYGIIFHFSFRSTINRKQKFCISVTASIARFRSTCKFSLEETFSGKIVQIDRESIDKDLDIFEKKRSLQTLDGCRFCLIWTLFAGVGRCAKFYPNETNV